MVEQNRLLMDEAGARPVHRADIYLIDRQAKEMWMDVRITTATPDVPVETGPRRGRGPQVPRAQPSGRSQPRPLS